MIALHHHQHQHFTSNSLYADENRETLPNSPSDLLGYDPSDVVHSRETKKLCMRSSKSIQSVRSQPSNSGERVVPDIASTSAVQQQQPLDASVAALRKRSTLSSPRDFVAPAKDVNLLNDDRVLSCLTYAEHRTTPLHDYFQRTQSEVTERMRHIVVDWMLEVCDELKADSEVFALAVSFFDRFLSLLAVYKTQLQGLSCACLLLASKVKQPVPFSAKKLVVLADGATSLADLVSWELLVLGKLNWEVSTVTALDFIEHFLVRMSLPQNLISRMRPEISKNLCVLLTDFKLAVLPASHLAAVSICLAGMRVIGEGRATLPALLAQVQHLRGSATDVTNLRNHVEHAEDYLNKKCSMQV